MNTRQPGEYLWPFDSTLRDTSSTFNGTPTNDPTFSNSTITGYGSSLSLQASLRQSVSIAQPFLPLFNRSWTFEVWIYLSNVDGWSQYPIVEQCESRAKDLCLHLVVREKKIRLGFYDDDVDSKTEPLASRWYHIAFTFEIGTRNQSIYLDGVLDKSRKADNAYLGTSGALTIGKYQGWAGLVGIIHYFDGLIDQLSFFNRFKTSQEILRDATLTLHVAFDGSSIHDQGPLSINGYRWRSHSVSSPVDEVRLCRSATSQTPISWSRV